MKTKMTRHFLLGTLRGQLILGVALVHAILMTLFIVDLVSRQHKMLIQQQEKHAIALSQSLSTSASEWLAANDIAGLQELVDAQKRYPELDYAILADINGQILAHTDRPRAGQYLMDLPLEKKLTVLSKGEDLVDVAAPAMLGGRQVGWIRVGLNQKMAGKQLSGVTWSGVLYALIAICIGTAIAWWMGIRITRRLYAVQDTINAVSKGDSKARSRLDGRDEAAILAQEFDYMLDTLEERNREVQKNRTLFENLFHSATVPMVYIDKTGRLLNYNHSFEKIFGYNNKDFSSFEEWWLLTCPYKENPGKNLRNWNREWQQAFGMHTKTEQQEFTVTCKNGESRTILVSGNALAEDMLVTLMDVTNLKKTEAALRKSESSLNEAQRVAHIGSWELDHVHNILSWSEENYRIFGMNPGETPYSYETFLSLVHPDDREFVNRMYTDSVKNHTRYDIEHRIILEGNRIKYLHEQCETIYNPQGEPLLSIGTTQDITERKQAELKQIEALERYDLLTRASSDTIWDWQIATGEIIYNQGLSKTFGYQVSSINSIEQWWEKNIYPDDFDRVQHALNTAFLKQKESLQLEYRFRCADGSYKYVKDRAFVLYNKKGEPERMIGSMSDITQEIEFASKIEKAVIDAQEKEWNQIGMELHDNVNQLLAASLMYLAFGMEKQKGLTDQPSSELQKCESHVREAIQEIRKLSHQLAPASSREMSLEEIFRSLLDTIPKNKLHINFDIKDVKEFQISTELQTNLYRILQEQLNNILKYAEASEIKISLKEKKGILIFRITDNGIGFDASTRRKGIGLENIRRRAIAFSGDFKLKTAPGQGCEVLVSIPLQKTTSRV